MSLLVRLVSDPIKRTYVLRIKKKYIESYYLLVAASFSIRFYIIPYIWGLKAWHLNFSWMVKEFL